MARHRTGATNARQHARRAAARGDDVRRRMREVTVRALRDRELPRGEVSRVVGDVLRGASDGVERLVPSSRRRAFRDALEGVADAVNTVASAGVDAARGLARRSANVIDHDLPEVMRRITDANAEMVDAAASLARRLTGEAREELQMLVQRSREAGSGRGSRRGDPDAGLAELGGEAARAGLNVVRRAASGLAMAAGGFLEGLGEVADTRSRSTSRSAPRSTRSRASSGRVGRTRKPRTTTRVATNARKAVRKAVGGGARKPARRAR